MAMAKRWAMVQRGRTMCLSAPMMMYDDDDVLCVMGRCYVCQTTWLVIDE